MFGQVIEVHIPREGGKEGAEQVNTPHRGFGFITFSSTESAEDAIDNMHLNEWGGKILNVNFARPMGTTFNSNKPVWQDEVRIALWFVMDRRGLTLRLNRNGSPSTARVSHGRRMHLSKTSKLFLPKLQLSHKQKWMIYLMEPMERVCAVHE